MRSVVGREPELEQVGAFLGRKEVESPVAFALAGEPGIGKTTVWARAVAGAAERGSLVLAARPAEAEAGLSFAGLADLMMSVPERAFESIPTIQRTALDVALLRARARRPPDRRLIGSALLSVLRVLSEQTEVVLAIDDLHWLDAASAAAVQFALRRAAHLRVRAMFSVRSDEPQPGLLIALARDRELERLELGPLTVAALHRILADELGRTFPRRMLVRIATASHGNPLYAIEIARPLDRADARAPLSVPSSLSSLVAARIRALPVETREALLRAAASAKPDLRLVDAEALAPAEEAGLVRIRDDRQIEFVHPLYASAVYLSAAARRRRRTHALLAELVADPEERARHMALACDGPDSEVARALDAASRQARLRGAPDTAAELLELALRLTPADAVPFERQIELAENLYLTGDFERGIEVLDAADSFPGDLRARALLLLAELVYRQRGQEEGAAVAREAVAAAREPILRARCHLRLAGWGTTLDLREAAGQVEAASALLEQCPASPAALRAAALGTRVNVDVFLGRGLDLEKAQEALALQQAEPPRDIDDRLVFRLGVWYRYLDQFAAARAQFAEAQRIAREEGDDASLVNILFNRMVVELSAGEWKSADGIAAELAETADQLALSNVARPWIAYLDAHRGRLDAVRDACGQAESGNALLQMLNRRALATAELGAGLYEAADDHFAQVFENLDAMGVGEPAIWRVDGDAIEAALGAGRPSRARGLLAPFRERAERSPLPWSLAVSTRCCGLVAAAEGELELATAVLESALVEQRRCPVPFEAARTLLAHGRVLRRRKQRRKARESLEQATMIFAKLGAAGWLEQAEGELRRVAARPAPAALSATELRIARLAAEGLSNRVIAERAFVSVKTVETNLKRAYRKLGISSRAQLGRALDERNTPLVS